MAKTTFTDAELKAMGCPCSCLLCVRQLNDIFYDLFGDLLVVVPNDRTHHIFWHWKRIDSYPLGSVAMINGGGKNFTMRVPSRSMFNKNFYEEFQGNVSAKDYVISKTCDSGLVSYGYCYPLEYKDMASIIETWKKFLKTADAVEESFKVLREEKLKYEIMVQKGQQDLYNHSVSILQKMEAIDKAQIKGLA
jgi:hypothetical protein